jgi:hypothetical protein
MEQAAGPFIDGRQPMRHDTEPQALPMNVEPNAVPARSQAADSGVHAANDTAPGSPPAHTPEPSDTNDTAPGAAPVAALDATLQGFRRRPRVEVEEALETAGADAARGHVAAHLPPRRAEARFLSKRVIIDEGSPAPPAGPALGAAPRANNTAPMGSAPASGAGPVQHAPSPEPVPLTPEALARFAPTVQRRPARSTRRVVVVVAAVVLTAALGLASTLLVRRGGRTSTPSPPATSGTPSVTSPAPTVLTTEAPPSAPELPSTSPHASNNAQDRSPASTALSPTSSTESSRSPHAPKPPGAARPATPAAPLPVPPSRSPQATSSSPSSTGTPLEPKRTSPPSDILRNQ